MTTVYVPRISDPNKFVEVEFTDLGESMLGYDKNGNPFPAYTSMFEFNGTRVYSIADKRVADNTQRDRYRFEEHDIPLLARHDLDLFRLSEDKPVPPAIPLYHKKPTWFDRIARMFG